MIRIIFFTFLFCLRAGFASASESLYLFDKMFTNQNGQPVTLGVGKGHPVMISMFYGNCRYVCPALIGSIQKMEASLEPKVREELRVVLISLDPARDTPEALNALARKRHIDTKRWSLLTSLESTIQEIAALLDIKYRRLPDGNFNHSTIFTLLDQKGAIQMQYEGAKPSPEIIEKLNSLAVWPKDN